MKTYSNKTPVIFINSGILSIPYNILEIESEDGIQYSYDTISQNVTHGISQERILEISKETLVNVLNANLQTYILSYYDIGTQIQFHSIYQRVESEKIKDRIKSVGSWVDSVLAYYYSKKTEILSAQDEKALIAISWDYYTFNSTKPDVSLGGLFV